MSEKSENTNMTAGSTPLSPGAGSETQAGHVLLMPDVMSCAFRADEATEAAVEALLGLQLVCRGWQKSIGLAVRDKLWLRPLRESGQRFCAKFPLLVENIISLVNIEQRQERFAHFEAQTRAHMFDADTLVGALQAMDPILEDQLMDEASVLACIDILDTAMQAHPRHAWVHYEVAHAMDYFVQSNPNSDYMTHKGIPEHLVGACMREPLQKSMRDRGAYIGPPHSYHNSQVQITGLESQKIQHKIASCVKTGLECQNLIRLSRALVGGGTALRGWP